MESATPEGLAAEAAALWPRWAAHLAALAAGAQPADPAGSGAGARLAQVLEALWLDRTEAAAAAADGLWARALGREEGGLLVSVASLSALLAAFRTRPGPCLELAAATHLTILCCAVLLPGSSTKQQLGSSTPTREALEQLCFKACPQALLGALGPAAGQSLGESPRFILRADPSLPHQAFFLGNALSCWRHCLPEPPGLPSLLEELEWVRGWVSALDALTDAGLLTGPITEMHEALVPVCSRALIAASREQPRRVQAMKRLLEEPQLLPWYTEELLRTVRDDIIHCDQGGGKVYRGHWLNLVELVFYWEDLREEFARNIAAQPRLQEWWLEALAALNAEAEAPCRAGACSLTRAPASMLHCWGSFISTEASREQSRPEHMTMPMSSFGILHRYLHKQLLATDAAAAQRSEAAAVAAALCCLRVLRAVDGWQGELAGTGQKFACEYAGDALQQYLVALDVSPAFSCEAARRQGSPCIPGKRAVAAVIDVLQLAAEALRVVVDSPSLDRVQAAKFAEGGASMSAAICSAVSHIASSFEMQTLPGGQVPLIRCVTCKQLLPILRAMLGLLCSQRKALAWLRGAGRSNVTAPLPVTGCLGLMMENCVFLAAFATLSALQRHTLLSPATQAAGRAGLAVRWRVALMHVALPAALGAHTLPGVPFHRTTNGELLAPTGLMLAWRHDEALASGGGISQWTSGRAWAAKLMCATVRSVVASTDRTPGEAAEALVSMLASVNLEVPFMTAALTALASGMFSHLAGWATRITRRPTNLLEPHVAQALLRLEQLVSMVCHVADALLLRPSEGARFAAANKRLSAQVQRAIGTLSQGRPQSRRQLGAHGIGAAVRGAWEHRRDQLLPPMERGARCGSAFVVAWQSAGNTASGGGSEAAAAAAACHSCPLPAVQQELALAGVVCANPICTRLGRTSEGGAGAALERLQRCRGCHVASYCCPECGREDWERHRLACNALRHLRHSTASVQPAVGLWQE